MKQEIVILGERSKWVPVSSQRIQQIEDKNGDILLDIIGKPDEVIAIFLGIKGLNDTVLWLQHPLSSRPEFNSLVKSRQRL